MRAPPSTPAPGPDAASGKTTAATPVVPNAAPAPAAVHDTTLRVASDKLDVLLQHTGELLVALSTGADRAFLERSARRVDEEVRNIRMLPFSLACEGLERIVRDCAASEGKKCRLHVIGGAIELDRAILDGLRDPLQHLVRNAIIHGIESPERRAANRKSVDGSITVTAALHGGGVEVTVEDDGNGLDLVSIRTRAEERGYAVNDLDVGGAIFLPGVSTARGLTKEAGRGVGMDAVRSSIETLRGTITVHSEPAAGTRFALLVPLTLTTVRAVIFEVAGTKLAIESAAVERFVRPRPEDIVSVEGRPRIMRDGSATPLVDCATLLHLADEMRSPNDARYVIFIKDTLGRVALAVDLLIEEREVVVRPLGRRMEGIRSAIGATLLADGSAAVILRGAYIVQQSHERARVSPHAEDAQVARKRVLLVEDSITTRTLERSILEAAGYDVTTAGDGEEAWSLLQESADRPGRHRRRHATPRWHWIDGAHPRGATSRRPSRRSGYRPRHRCGQAPWCRCRRGRVRHEGRLRSGRVVEDASGTLMKHALVAVGASAGGPAALHEILSRIDRDFALPIVITQHITPGFVDGMVRWLDDAMRAPGQGGRTR